MVKDSEIQRVLSKYPRAIVHLRSQVRNKRFGLVLGAGISRDFGVPTWLSLVGAISKDTNVDGEALINGEAESKSLPYRSEMLFQRFRGKKVATDANLITVAEENTIRAEWIKLCQLHIYGKVPSDFASSLSGHPYFEALIPLVQQSYLTINFNFDDLLERSLALKKRSEDKANRGFETVTDPWPQFRRTNSVIYHPHGYIPSGIMESPVDRFVFSEAAYSNQYVGSRGQDSSFLTAHFARNTCLLIGCALEEELRNVLMRGAQINPGNYHYYIHFLEDGKTLDVGQQSLIEETNFKVYNLITLFLTAKDIALVLSLINAETVDDTKLKDVAVISNTPLQYTFYMTGPIGVGKSTTANHFRNLHVLDEWLEQRLEILGKPWDELTPPERIKADHWIADQFKKKNDTLRHLSHASINVVESPRFS